MKKIVFKGITLICACIMLTACGIQKDSKQKNAETEYRMSKEMISETTQLNERQKKIMEKEGLSTVYSQLTDRQKEAAIKAEMLLTYLEEKYNKEFVYESYLDTYVGCLVARDLDDDLCRHVQASLGWDGEKYTYSDTYYEDVLAPDEYEKLFDGFMAENYPEPDYFLDISVAKVDGDKITTDNACVALRIIMKSCFDSVGEYKDFLTDVAKWMQNCKYNNRIYLQVMKEEDFSRADYFNYARLMREGSVEYRFDCAISRDGTITITERN